MIIIETSVFTRQVHALLTDEEYRQLQIVLLAHPDMGTIIPGSGGLRNSAGLSREKENVVAHG
jgi:hypothetical protein